MTQEEKELLIKDLSSRLADRVKFPIYWWNEETQTDEEIVATLYSINTDGYCEIFDHDGTVYIDNIKPYLRPLSSMTEEEELVFSLAPIYASVHYNEVAKMDWLDKNMFDYRGLIQKGLAIEAPEGVYNVDKPRKGE